MTFGTFTSFCGSYTSVLSSDIVLVYSVSVLFQVTDMILRLVICSNAVMLCWFFLPNVVADARLYVALYVVHQS